MARAPSRRGGDEGWRPARGNPMWIRSFNVLFALWRRRFSGRAF
jgi:hypothetical protein